MNKFVESMKEVDFSDMKIPMLVIYDSPADMPGMYVCRIWEVVDCRPTNTAMRKKTLEEMREDIQAAGFTIKLPRTESDDPVIVESWAR